MYLLYFVSVFPYKAEVKKFSGNLLISIPHPLAPFILALFCSPIQTRALAFLFISPKPWPLHVVVLSAFSQVITLPCSDFFCHCFCSHPRSINFRTRILALTFLFLVCWNFSKASGVSLSLIPYFHRQRHQFHHRRCIHLRTVLAVWPQLLLSIVGIFLSNVALSFLFVSTPAITIPRRSLWQGNSTLV